MQAMTSTHIELWPIDKLIFYSHNPRKNDAAVDRMVASIREFGFKIPVLVRSNGEVVDGHLRLKAARKLKITGGNIRNIILAAAFLAAEEHDRIGMRHLIRAAGYEYQKMGKMLLESDFGPYLELTRSSSGRVKTSVMGVAASTGSASPERSCKEAPPPVAVDSAV